MTIAAEYVPDPQWFYSSMAQVSGAIVGVFGAALIVRIQARRSDWRSTRTKLQVELHKINRKKGQGRSGDISEVTRGRVEDLVGELREARFPSELWALVGFIIALLVGGVFFPLLFLEKPDFPVRLGMALMLVILAAAALMYVCVSAIRALIGHQAYADEEFRRTFGEDAFGGPQ